MIPQSESLTWKESAVGSDQGHADRGGIEGAAKPFLSRGQLGGAVGNTVLEGLGELPGVSLALAEHLLGPLALGDVADDAGENPPLTQPDLAHREIHWEGAAVLATADDLAADADDLPLAGPEVTGQVVVVLVAIRCGHQHADVLAEQLLGRISEVRSAGGIEALDRAALVNGDDAVDGRIDDAAYPRLALAKVRVSQGQLFGPLGDNPRQLGWRTQGDEGRPGPAQRPRRPPRGDSRQE